MNILVTHPDFELVGGVSNYFKQLRGKSSVYMQHFVIGRRPKEGCLARVYRMLVDYRRFVKCLQKGNIDLVHINLSLDFKCFIRDGISALLAVVNKKRVVVFFHGWKRPCEVRVERFFLWLFRWFFGRTDAFIVSSDQQRKTLERWGIVQSIYKEVTVINEDELAGFDIQKAVEKRQISKKWRILFLSRVVRAKGIYETVRAVSLLQAKYPVIELLIAGVGEELEKVRCLVRDLNMSNVKFLGYVSDEEKRLLFEQSHIFCLLSHSEGFPVSVVEAMAFGLPVVTRPVGGLVDFFKNEEHGFISDSLDPSILANLIERLLLDKSLYEKISTSNYQYAQSHFLASDAVLRLETIYKTVLSRESALIERRKKKRKNCDTITDHKLQR